MAEISPLWAVRFPSIQMFLTSMCSMRSCSVGISERMPISMTGLLMPADSISFAPGSPVSVTLERLMRIESVR